MKTPGRRLMVSLIAAALVHSVFSAQAIYAAQDRSGGLLAADFFFLACLPHVLLMFFLPPAWPSAELGDRYWWCVIGKLLVSFPASLFYGWFIGALWQVLHSLRRLSGAHIPKTRPQPPDPHLPCR